MSIQKVAFIGKENKEVQAIDIPPPPLRTKGYYARGLGSSTTPTYSGFSGECAYFGGPLD
jgi:hypothetical protein